MKLAEKSKSNHDIKVKNTLMYLSSSIGLPKGPSPLWPFRGYILLDLALIIHLVKLLDAIGHVAFNYNLKAARVAIRMAILSNIYKNLPPEVTTVRCTGGHLISES